MRSTLVVLLCSCLMTMAFAAEGFYNYRPDADWPGACADGESQTPINIERSVAEAGEDDMRFTSNTMGVVSRARLYFTRTALQVDFEEFSTDPDVTIPANEMIIGNSTDISIGDPISITPLQFHFHTFSEHTIDGFYAPAELHIVTIVNEGQSEYCDSISPGCLAVFGIMLNFQGDGARSSRALNRIFRRMPEVAGSENGFYIKGGLDLDDFLPSSLSYFHYLGGLTTPGCNEIVTWHVFDTPVPISVKHFKAHQMLVAFAGGEDCPHVFNNVCSLPREKTNHRDIQPRNGRNLYYFE
eukprot:g1780.t1